MDRIPILRMGDLLLVTIQVDMHDRLAMTLQDDLTARIVKERAKGVLIDISALEIEHAGTELGDEDLVVLEQRRVHRGGRDVERLDQEGLDQHRDHERPG